MKGIILILFLLFANVVYSNTIEAKFISQDLSQIQTSQDFWKNISESSIPLIAQPMVVPKPKSTHTDSIKVQALHDGNWLQVRLRWKDQNPSYGNKLGQFSDAVAIQFAVNGDPKSTSPFMGGKGTPVHIFHWRAQYLQDKEKQRVLDIQEIYPNTEMDMYQMDYKDSGNLKLNEEDKNQYLAGRAAGNPSSKPKLNGVDELLAEGFGTSASLSEIQAKAEGSWENGEWTVIITRPLKYKNASSIDPGKSVPIGFAVWRGDKDEVGSRKCVTISWMTLNVSKKD